MSTMLRLLTLLLLLTTGVSQAHSDSASNTAAS